MGHLCMTSDENKREVSLFPLMDRGGMEFPKRGLFPFLQSFDSILQQEINYKNSEQQGKHLFKVNTPKHRVFLMEGVYDIES